MITELLAVVTFGWTLAGGLFALRHRGKLQRILGFTSGVLLGVVAFDLLPEVHRLTLSTNSDFTTAMIALAAGFLIFYLIEKLTVIHSSRGDEVAAARRHPQLGVVTALALSAHSFSTELASAWGFRSPRRSGSPFRSP
jgi:ZIP family zinc transporter